MKPSTARRQPPAGRPCFGVAALLAVIAAATGCTGLEPVRAPGSLPARQPVQVPVTFFPQERYQCGPAALAMALDWSGLEVAPDDLVESVYTPSRRGSLQPALVAAARRHGRVAFPIEGLEALGAELSAGHPVIVLQNLSLPIWPRWHYAVVIGLEPEENIVRLHSGPDPHRRTGLRTFMNTWRRGEHWGLLVLPPDRLPATADDVSWVKAVTGLERAGRQREALAAYRAALARWPESVPAHMGLGNAHYALGEPARAETAYREVIGMNDGYALAWNNLAQALADQGRTGEALQAAERAVSLGGPYREAFEETLRSIREMR